MANDLTRRAEALDASDRACRQLLADVSHELMTPLTAMRGYVERCRCEQHGGSVTARNDHGAVFEIALPH